MSGRSGERWRQRLDHFVQATARLTEACDRREYSDLERAGLVKTFEFCFELSWKTLKDLLFYEGIDAPAPRAVIRGSFEAGHVSEADCEIFLDALQKRNVLSHAYRREAALEAERLIKDRYAPMLRRLAAALEKGRES